MLRRIFASTSKLPASLPAAASPSSSRLLHTSSSLRAAPRPIPPPHSNISTATDFLKAISTPPRRDLTADSSLVSLVSGEGDWEKLWKLNGTTLRKNTVPIKTRRYLLWAMEKFRQGLDPAVYRLRPKKKRVVRGWGPRVQNGIRVSGRKRPGEKCVPRR